MNFRVLLLFYFCTIVLCNPHNPKQKNGFKEKVEDGMYTSRDNKHYKDGKHNNDFDHEAVLGSHDVAEEFNHLSSEEAKIRLYYLARKMDQNKDEQIDRTELTNWVLQSFKMLTKEEALDELEDVDSNEDGKVTFEEHSAETYGIHGDEKNSFNNFPEESQMFENDLELFKTADLNSDGFLDKEEYPAFSHPEEFEHMHDVWISQAMRRKDKDKDGLLIFEEFIADTYGASPDPTAEHFITEKDRFENDLDINGDKKLNREEVMNWLIPNNNEIAENEADHLIESSDMDKDGKLSLDEVVEHYEVFVGSEATDFGEHLQKLHPFRDEL